MGADRDPFNGPDQTEFGKRLESQPCRVVTKGRPARPVVPALPLCLQGDLSAFNGETGLTVKVALFNVTTTTKTGGVESFVWELARYLTANYADCQVDIIGG